MIEHVDAIGGERQLEQRARERVARLDQREETPRGQIEALQRAADLADDLAHQPVILVRVERRIDVEHRLRVTGRAQQTIVPISGSFSRSRSIASSSSRKARSAQAWSPAARNSSGSSAAASPAR